MSEQANEVEPSLTILIPQTITEDRIRCLLCSAFEGGSTYWSSIIRYTYTEGTNAAEYGPDGKYQTPNDYWPRYCLLPLIKDCGVLVGDCEVDNPEDENDAAFKPVLLNRDAIIKGLKVMATDYPRYYADFMAGSDDADTGDVFLQCCLLGEVMFG